VVGCAVAEMIKFGYKMINNAEKKSAAGVSEEKPEDSRILSGKKSTADLSKQKFVTTLPQEKSMINEEQTPDEISPKEQSEPNSSKMPMLEFSETFSAISHMPQPAKIGISRLWVHRNFRSQNIATKLVDVVRANFVFGEVVKKELVAFSQPSPEGKKFATKYFGTLEFLVYIFE